MSRTRPDNNRSRDGHGKKETDEARRDARRRPDILPADYERFLGGLKERIRNAQLRAALSVNRELVLLYWELGRDILARQEEQGWGAKVIDRLAADLRRAFPEMSGFSPRNFKYTRSFAAAWPDGRIVQGPLAQITWYHNVTLVEKLKDPDERLWYARAAVEHGWSRNVLVLQIESGLFRRQGKAVTNFQATLPPYSPPGIMYACPRVESPVSVDCGCRRRVGIFRTAV